MVYWIAISLLYVSAYREYSLDVEVVSTCLDYSCNTNSTSEFCVEVEGLNAILTPCEKGYYCPASLETLSVSANCTWAQNPYPTEAYAYPAEPCRYSADCLSQNCMNSTCVGESLNGLCTLARDCGPGLYCDGDRCLEQLKVEEIGCVDDTYCVNGSGCNATDGRTGQCQPYFSVPPGDPIAYCDPSNLANYLCEYYVCYPNNNRDTAGVCAGPVQSNSTLPVPCNSKNDCINQPDPAKNDTTLTSDCDCALSANASSYCQLFPGDPYGVQFLSMLKKWVNSTQISNCNAEKELSFDCMNTLYPTYLGSYQNSTNSTQWNFSDFVTIQYYYYRYFYYAESFNALDCAKSIYMPKLYNSEAAYEKETEKKPPSPQPYKDFGIGIIVAISIFSLI